jgi:hypothetical protein
MNQSDALVAMRHGYTVRGINGLYLTHVEHGGKYLYRLNGDRIERLEPPRWGKSFGVKHWRESKGSFYLHQNFEIWAEHER